MTDRCGGADPGLQCTFGYPVPATTTARWLSPPVIIFSSENMPFVIMTRSCTHQCCSLHHQSAGCGRRTWSKWPVRLVVSGHGLHELLYLVLWEQSEWRMPHSLYACISASSTPLLNCGDRRQGWRILRLSHLFGRSKCCSDVRRSRCMKEYPSESSGILPNAFWQLIISTLTPNRAPLHCTVSAFPPVLLTTTDWASASSKTAKEFGPEEFEGWKTGSNWLFIDCSPGATDAETPNTRSDHAKAYGPILRFPVRW